MKRNDYLCLLSSLTIITFVVLFLYRSADDNRLTSWDWVFTHVLAGRVLLIITIGLIFSFFFVKHHVALRYPALFLFSVAFGLTTFFWSVPELIIDASRYFTQAKHLEQFGIRYFVQEWGRSIEPWTDLPLIPFLYGLLLSVSGESRLAVQMFVSLMYSLTAVVIFLLGRDLWDEETGFRGGLLFMGIPYLLIQVPLFLVDIPTMFFFILALYLFQKAVRCGGYGSVLFSSAAVTMAILSKFSLWPVIILFPVITLLPIIVTRGMLPSHGVTDRNGTVGREEKGAGKVSLSVCLRRCAAVIVCSSLVTAVVIFHKYDVFAGQIALLLEYQKPGLRRWGESFVSTFLFQVHPFITVAALYSFWIALKKRDIRHSMISLFVLVAVLFQIKRIRYVIPVFPMLSLMAAYGLGGIRDRELKRFIVACVLVSSLAISLFAYLPFARRVSTVNLKNTGQLLDASGIEKAEVYVLSQQNAPLNSAVAVPILDLFTRARILFDYRPADFTPEENIEESAVRFTWAYKNPVYYESKEEFGEGDSAVVIVTSEKDYTLKTVLEEKIKNRPLMAFFDDYEGAFQFRTFVAVYGPQRITPGSSLVLPGS